jgi:hypothetical protein
MLCLKGVDGRDKPGEADASAFHSGAQGNQAGCTRELTAAKRMYIL